MIPWINAVYKKKIEKILSEKSGMPVKLVLKTQESSDVPIDVPTAEPTPKYLLLLKPEKFWNTFFLPRPIRKRKLLCFSRLP